MQISDKINYLSNYFMLNIILVIILYSDSNNRVLPFINFNKRNRIKMHIRTVLFCRNFSKKGEI